MRRIAIAVLTAVIATTGPSVAQADTHGFTCGITFSPDVIRPGESTTMTFSGPTTTETGFTVLTFNGEEIARVPSTFFATSVPGLSYEAFGAGILTSFGVTAPGDGLYSYGFALTADSDPICAGSLRLGEPPVETTTTVPEALPATGDGTGAPALLGALLLAVGAIATITTRSRHRAPQH